MQAKVIRSETIDWIQPPQHIGCYSKPIFNYTNSDARYVDFRISITRPQGYIETHVHQEAENIYYVIQGKGIVELDGERHFIEQGTAILIPPGVHHALYNTGYEDLITVFVGAPWRGYATIVIYRVKSYAG